jgi:hypothetical protein
MFTQQKIAAAEFRTAGRVLKYYTVDVDGSQPASEALKALQEPLVEAIKVIENTHGEFAVMVVCSMQLAALKYANLVEYYDTARQVRHVDGKSEYAITEVGNFNGTPILLDPYRVSNTKPIQVFSATENQNLINVAEVKVTGTIRLY